MSPLAPTLSLSLSCRQCVGLIFSWIKLLKYVRAFSSFGPFVVILGRMASDVARFCLLYLELLLPFTFSFYLLLSNSGLAGYDTVSNALYSVFLMGFSNFDPQELQRTENIMGPLLSSLWIFVGGLCFVNLFVAMLSKRFTDVSELAEEVSMRM